MGFEVETLPKHPEKIYRNLICDGCGSKLKNIQPVFDNTDGWSCLQPDDALILNLEGGYGMAIDPCHALEQELTKLFCGLCVQKLSQQWPCIAETIQNHCSTSLGHFCAKERQFVWRTLSHCCYVYCSRCGEFAGTRLNLSDSSDRYSRIIINCSECGSSLPGLWSWEIKSYRWYLDYYQDGLDQRSGPFSSEEEAKIAERDMIKKVGVSYLGIEQVAIIF